MIYHAHILHFTSFDNTLTRTENKMSSCKTLLSRFRPIHSSTAGSFISWNHIRRMQKQDDLFIPVYFKHLLQHINFIGCTIIPILQLWDTFLQRKRHEINQFHYIFLAKPVIENSDNIAERPPSASQLQLFTRMLVCCRVVT